MNYPPLWRRLMAMIYDGFLLIGVSVGYTLIYLLIAHFVGQVDIEKDTRSELFRIGLVGVWIGFYSFFWLREGHTLGMRVWRLKIVSDGYRPLTLLQCIKRQALAILSMALLGLGYWWALVDKKKQTLHDKLSNTETIMFENEK